MKKILGLITGLILLSSVSNAQINLATTLRQDTNIKVLRQIRSALVQGSVTVNTATFQLTSTTTSVTTSGAVTTGASSILFETSLDFVGTIDGVAFGAGGFLPYSGGPGGKLPAIPYTISAGAIYIRKLSY